jgi:succinate dehydrogenase/fumarate reductase flavoprotein subunit
MNSFRQLVGPGATVLAIALGACATAPPPTEELAGARAAIEAANVAGAARTSSLELTQARQKLSAAELAAHDGDQVKARRLAEQAQVDAEVAQAKASAVRSREGLAQAQTALQALREESTRRPATATSPTPNTSGPAVTPSR